MIENEKEKEMHMAEKSQWEPPHSPIKDQVNELSSIVVR